MASWWNRLRGATPPSDEQYEREIERLRRNAPIPVLWLFGKTGSGKSSVVRFLTGAEDATIGSGYRPETRYSRRFDFPDALEPLLTFLDTRGLGEASYDPQEDIERFSGATQLMIVTVRVGDQALASVVEPLRRIRRSAPERPVLLVLTCLHELAGEVDLSRGPDPFATPPANAASRPGPESDPGEGVGADIHVPTRLGQAIDAKREQFAGLVDVVVPVDLTQPGDGFHDPNFGGGRLQQAILDHLPHAYRQALLALHDGSSEGRGGRRRRARWQVLASSALAASAGAVPVPWVDIPAVLAIQAHLAVRIAKIHETELTPAQWAVLSSAAGSRVALRLTIRAMLKLIPVVGMAAGAASAFAFTYALGMSWDWYFATARGGDVPTPEELRVVFDEQLKRGHELWRAP